MTTRVIVVILCAVALTMPAVGTAFATVNTAPVGTADQSQEHSHEATATLASKALDSPPKRSAFVEALLDLDTAQTQTPATLHEIDGLLGARDHPGAAGLATAISQLADTTGANNDELTHRPDARGPHLALDELTPLLERNQPGTNDPVHATEVLDALARALDAKHDEEHLGVHDEDQGSPLARQTQLLTTASAFTALANDHLTAAGQGGQPSTGERLITASQLLSSQASLAARIHATPSDGLEQAGESQSQNDDGFASVACLEPSAPPAASLSTPANTPPACQSGDARPSAYELAAYATRLQAARAGIPVPASAPVPAHALPSQAINTLRAEQALPARGTDDPALQALDALNPTIRDPLTDLIDALNAYDRAATHAYQHGTTPTATERGILLAARRHVLATTQAFETALSEGATLFTSGPVYDDHPLLRIDLSGTSRDYTKNYTYLIDAGGSDAYMNNAGGNTFGDCNQTVDAAALIDLNTPDTAGSPAPHETDYFNTDRTGLWTANACGKAGGAWGPGSGLLVSTEGDDIYGERYNPLLDIHQRDYQHGINGGADGPGTGLLIDTSGNDTHVVGGDGTNGGAHATGALGLLVDANGHDTYQARDRGTNGGADAPNAHGTLLDAAGKDTYITRGQGTNGGANGQGATAMLIDLAGLDTYDAGHEATNGGASKGGLGALVDIDDPESPGEKYYAWHDGTNGGATGQGSAGMLADLGSAQRFDGGHRATNGGARDGATGLLLTTGSAVFHAGEQGTNGGADAAGTQSPTTALAVALGTSPLISAWGEGTNGGATGPNAAAALITGGSKTYRAFAEGTNGGANAGAAGLLADLGPVGPDTSTGSLTLDPSGQSADYQASFYSDGVNGGANGANSHAALIDLGITSDTYTAGWRGINGGATGTNATALLLDTGGSETYDAGSKGTNGGGHDGGQGALFDLPGVDLAETDVYDAGGQGTNGGATGIGSAGLLVDLGFSDDTLTAGSTGTNGGGANGGAGFVFNDNGEDTYTAGDDGTNGGAVNDGIGLLIDQEEDDTYIAGINGVNGGADSATGLLLDTGGFDTFDEGNNAYDCSQPGNCNVIPKGNTGARISL